MKKLTKFQTIAQKRSKGPFYPGDLMKNLGDSRENRESWQVCFVSQGPHSHILMTEGGPKDFFGSDILAKRDFLGSMKDAGIFLGRENNTGIFLGIVFFISSNQQ